MYAMVSADFPDVTAEQRKLIYECLEKKNWTKFKNVGRDISTCWFGFFKSEIDNVKIIEITEENFKSCSKPYCIPKLAIHIGVSKPIEI